MRIKLFENYKGDFDYEYIKMCFIELIEDNYIKYSEDDDICIISFEKFSTPYIIGESGTKDSNETLSKLKLYINSLKECENYMMDIETSIKRLLDKYPNYVVDIFYDDGLMYGELMDKPVVKIIIKES